MTEQDLQESPHGERSDPLMIDWHFFSHILRDVFGKFETPLILGSDTDCIKSFRSNEHSLGFTLIYTGKEDISGFKYATDGSLLQCLRFWGPEYCDLFVSLESENVLMLDNNLQYAVDLIKSGGLFLSLSDNSRSVPIAGHFTARNDLSKSLKQYSMFMDKDVFVYEKI